MFGLRFTGPMTRQLALPRLASAVDAVFACPFEHSWRMDVRRGAPTL